MTLTLVSNVSAMGPNLTTYFLASGGTAPYTYSVIPGGAGGTINATTGQYTSPTSVNLSPNFAYDTIQALDSISATATLKILIGTPLILFCDILQNQLGLDNNHIYLWDQKLIEPKDYSLYIAVGVMNSRPFGNTNYWDGANQTSIQSINMLDTLSVDAISRGPQARDQRANILMALNSNYSEQQQEFNSFNIGLLPANSQFTNLSIIDGAAIPYRFRISINMQYFVTLTKNPPYYSNFQTVQVTPNS
jgi:hypothetical protein